MVRAWVRTVESGVIHTADTSTPYTSEYRQPLRNFLVHMMYHFWEQRTRRIYKWLDRYRPVVADEIDLPYNIRQEVKCWGLRVKNREVLSTVYGSEVPRREWVD